MALRHSTVVPAGRQSRRLVLALCTVVGLLVPWYFFVVSETAPLGWDFRAYFVAAHAAAAGEPFVAADPGIKGVKFVYPPVTVFAFLPYAAIDSWQQAFVVHAAAIVGAAAAIAALVVHTVESRGVRLPPTDRLLIFAFCVLSVPSLATVGLGQIDVVVALALAVGFVALDRGRSGVAGVAIGLAALFKLFPAILGLWLVRQRAWKALASAAATGLAGLAVGVLAFGLDTHRQYLALLGSRSRVEEFAGTMSPNFLAMSLFRPLSQLLPDVDPSLYGPIAVTLVAPAILVGYRHAGSRENRLATYLLTIVAAVVVSPASNVHYVVYAFFPLLSLLYLLDDERVRAGLLLGTLMLSLPVQPRHLSGVVAELGLPTAVTAGVLDVFEAFLTVGSIPLWGLLLVLVACAATSGRARRGRTTTDRVQSAD